MKKIYINGRFLTQKITGVQRYALEIVKGIDKEINYSKNYEFIILVPKNIKQTISFNNIRIKKVGHLKGHLWEQIELPFYSRNGLLLSFCGCAPLIKKNQIVTLHDAAFCANPKSFAFKFRIWYRIMFYILGHRVNKILTVSNFSKKELNKYFSIDLNKIDITYNGIDHILNVKPNESIFNRFQIEKNNYVLAVSSLNPSKNFKLILKAAKQMPNVNFIIAGGTNSNVFKSKGLPVTDNVKFIGYVTDEELVSLYKYANCFIYPSLYEGFGIPPLEAISFDCPVILSDIDVFREIYSNNVLYCDKYSVDELIEKINLLIKDDRIRKHFIIKARKLMNIYNWEISTKKIFEAIKNSNFNED